MRQNARSKVKAGSCTHKPQVVLKHLHFCPGWKKKSALFVALQFPTFNHYKKNKNYFCHPFFWFWYLRGISFSFWESCTYAPTLIIRNTWTGDLCHYDLWFRVWIWLLRSEHSHVLVYKRVWALLQPRCLIYLLLVPFSFVLQISCTVYKWKTSQWFMLVSFFEYHKNLTFEQADVDFLLVLTWKKDN